MVERLSSAPFPEPPPRRCFSFLPVFHPQQMGNTWQGFPLANQKCVLGCPKAPSAACSEVSVCNVGLVCVQRSPLIQSALRQAPWGLQHGGNAVSQVLSGDSAEERLCSSAGWNLPWIQPSLSSGLWHLGVGFQSKINSNLSPVTQPRNSRLLQNPASAASLVFIEYG